MDDMIAPPVALRVLMCAMSTIGRRGVVSLCFALANARAVRPIKAPCTWIVM